MSGHCKDCKHALDASWRNAGSLVCALMDNSKLIWIDGDASDAKIMVEPEFGCVEFAAKQ